MFFSLNLYYVNVFCEFYVSVGFACNIFVLTVHR